MNTYQKFIYLNILLAFGPFGLHLNALAVCANNASLSTAYTGLSEGDLNPYRLDYLDQDGTCSFTVTNSGSSTTGLIVRHSTLDFITQDGTLSSGRNALTNYQSIVSVFTNNGTVSGGDNGLSMESQGEFTTLINNGTISGIRYSGIINNQSIIGKLENNTGATISGGTSGIVSTGPITELVNSGIITGVSDSGIRMIHIMDRLTNNASGVISGYEAGIKTLSQLGIGILINDGTISSSNGWGIFYGDGSRREQLINSRTVSGLAGGIYSGQLYYPSQSVASITNSGLIEGTGTGSSGIVMSTGGANEIINSVGGTISGVDYGILFSNTSTLNTLTNDGIIKGDKVGIRIAMGGYTDGGIGTLINSGSIISLGVGGEDTSAGIINRNATINSLINSGTISGGYDGILNDYYGVINYLNNSGTISNSMFGIRNNRSWIDNLNNSGTIAANSAGIANGYFSFNRIATLTNSGTVAGSLLNSGSVGIINYNGEISTLTNTGTITGALYGIQNNGVIQTLNNQQGGVQPLTFAGNLPTYYNIIVASTTEYGKLVVAADNISGQTTFGISSSSTVSRSIFNVTLASVLTGMTPDRLGLGIATTYSGISNGYAYTLTQIGLNSGSWQLTISDYNKPLGFVFSELEKPRTGGVPVLEGSRETTRDFEADITVTTGTLKGNTTTLVGSIVNNSKVVFDQDTDGTFSGAMSGSGSLTKQNAGALILSGANTYSGGTTVTSGVLSVAGSSPTGSGDVYVAPDGTLMGVGKILGNIRIGGVINVGNSPGHLEALSTVVLETGSTYQQDIAGTAQANSDMPVGASGYYSYLTSVGQFTIDSGATLTPQLSNLFSPSESGYGSSIYVPVLGDRFRIVTAGGGISGRFSTLTQPAELSSGTQFIAFYNVNNSNSIELAVTPTSYDTDLASSKTNAQFVATVLDQLLITNKANAATATQDQLLYSVAGQTAASLPAFAQSLSGEIHAASVATLPQTTQRLHQAVLARLGDYQLPPTNINPGVGSSVLGGSMSTTNLSGAPTANMSSNPEVNPNAGATSAATADGRAWGEIAYQRAQRSGDGNANSFNSNLYQAVFGVDAYANAELGLKLGGGLALSNTTVSANSGSSTIQQGALFVYGKMPVLQDYVLDGMVSIGLSSTNLSRNDPTRLTGGFSKKSVMGNDAMVSAGISRPFTYSDVRITPYVRLTYQYVGQASYDEGSGAAALSISRFSGSAVRGTIGVAAGSLKKDPLKDGYTYRANIGVGADTTGLLNPIVNTTLGGFASSVTTPKAGAAFVQVGLYGTVKIADNAYAYAGVSAEARTGQTLYGGSVGLRLAF